MFGAALATPFGIWFARRRQVHGGGVPKCHITNFYHDFPNVSPHWHSTHLFWLYFVSSIALFGYVFARLTAHREGAFTDESKKNLRPLAAMVEGPL